MGTALLLNIPRHAHVNPALALASALVARGEQVICYLTDEFQAAVERTGAGFCRYETSMRPFRPEDQAAAPAPAAPGPDMVGSFMFGVLYEMHQVLPQVLASARAQRPDYVLYDSFCVWGRALARLLDVPAIALRPSYAVNERFSPGDFSARGAARDPQVEALVSRLTGRLARTHGLPVAELERLSSHVEGLNVVFLPRWFQPHAEDFDERFVFSGPAVVERQEAPAILPPPGADPLLFVSLGTVFTQEIAFYRRCISAFAGIPWRLVIAVGEGGDLGAIGPHPASVALHGGTYQLRVLEQTRVFLTHGGLCSVMEALYWGVPLVVVPHHPEHEVTARRVVELGLGACLSRAEAEDPAALRAAVLRVAEDEGCRERVRARRRELHAADGAGRAAEAVLSFLSSSSSSSSLATPGAVRPRAPR